MAASCFDLHPPNNASANVSAATDLKFNFKTLEFKPLGVLIGKTSFCSYQIGDAASSLWNHYSV